MINTLEMFHKVAGILKKKVVNIVFKTKIN